MTRLGCLIVVACHAAAPQPPAGGTTIATDRGVVAGHVRDGVREFLGIPYAAPPVGERRWRPPSPAAIWATPRDATRDGPACVQPDTGGFVRRQSEDCLTLDVWAPPGAERAPVLVWIHGGAFIQGSGGDDFYNGAKLAARTGAVVVTLNYRLGALGFLSHAALAHEAGRAASSSVGLLDQRAALQWVQRNIAAFGGDPASVTIFGGSAGAWSVCSQLASPGSRGLFARAIMQSGACADALYFDARTAAAQGDALAAALGCSGSDALACMRAKPAADVIAALPGKRASVLGPGVWWGPVVDGVELPALPLAAIRAGRFARVPLLIGWNRDEGTLHTVSFATVSEAELADFVRSAFGDPAVPAVATTYARPTPKAALDDVITDGIFACHARRVARAVTAHGVPVYVYEWTHALDEPRAHGLGATHSVELFFVWGNPGNGIGLSDAEHPLADRMMDAWGRFARHGDPGDGWPRYDPGRDELRVLDTTPAIAAAVKRDVCDFWDRLDR